ncbi:MAG: sigma-70 family RNA polymerase sigma factor [Dysosmobacter sp.]
MIEVFAYLLTKKPRIRDGGLKAYLYQSARHSALRHRHRLRRCFSLEALSTEPEGEMLLEEVIKTKERNRILHGCMEQLNPDYREALYLVYFAEMSYAQAAAVMGKSVKQITNMVTGASRACGDSWKRRASRMRSSEERIAAVKRRAAQLERRKTRLRSRMLAVASAAACLALIIGLAAAMPGITADIDAQNYAEFETAATMLGSGGALGYLVMALLAFLLGVCVTILCFRLRRREEENDPDRRQEDCNDGIH